MKTYLDFFAAFLTFILWPLSFVISIMALSRIETSSENATYTILGAAAVLIIPVLIFFSYSVSNTKFFNLNSKYIFITTIIIFGLCFYFLGHYKLLRNAIKKIPSQGYFTSKSTVFYNGNIITGADPKSFKSIGSLASEDKNSAYYRGKKIGENLKDFHWLNENCGISDDHLLFLKANANLQYSLVKALPNVDAKDVTPMFSFPFTKGGMRTTALILTDQKNLYILSDENSKIIKGVDQNSFKWVDHEKNKETYFKDKDSVYFLNENSDLLKLEGANPETFVVKYDTITGSHAHDGDLHYKGAIKLK